LLRHGGRILQTAIGGLIGAFGAIAGGAFGSWFTWQKERQSVAAALAGEVEAFMAVTEWYQTREFISRGYRSPIDDHPFPVFEANVGKIGFLPPDLARDVAGFYSHARRVVEEFLIINKGEPIEGPGRIAMVQNFAFNDSKRPRLGSRASKGSEKDVEKLPATD
jgi:hypothetical protein